MGSLRFFAQRGQCRGRPPRAGARAELRRKRDHGAARPSPRRLDVRPGRRPTRSPATPPVCPTTRRCGRARSSRCGPRRRAGRSTTCTSTPIGRAEPGRGSRRHSVERYEDVAESATEQLLERSWERRERQASRARVARRRGRGGAVRGGGRCAAARGRRATHPHAGEVGPFTGTAAPADRRVRAGRRASSFPVGAGYVVPTQLILVPMLLVLPPAAVPARGGRRDGARERRRLGFRPGAPAPSPVGGARRLARRRPGGGPAARRVAR